MQFTTSPVNPSDACALLSEMPPSPGCYDIRLSQAVVVAANASRVISSNVFIKAGAHELVMITGNLAAAEKSLFVHLQTILPNQQAPVVLHLVAVEDRQVNIPKDFSIATLVPISLMGIAAEEVEDFDGGDVDEGASAETDAAAIAVRNTFLAEATIQQLLSFAEKQTPPIQVDPKALKANMLQAILDELNERVDEKEVADE